MANYAKKTRRHFDKMNVDRNRKVPDLIFSTLLLSKNDIGLKSLFAKYAYFVNFETLKMGIALHFSVQLANHKSQRFYFGAIFKANNGTLRFHYRWLNFLMKKKDLSF